MISSMWETIKDLILGTDSSVPDKNNEQARAADEMNSDYLQQIGETKRYFVESSRRWFKVAIRLFWACVVLFGLNLVQFFTTPNPVYFAFTPDLRLQKMEPLTEPTVQDSELRNWVGTAVTKSLTFHYNNWRQRMSEVESYYTESAYTALAESIQEKGAPLNLVRENKFLVSASIDRETPQLTAKGTFEGAFTWRYEFPLTLTYRKNGNVQSTQQLMAKVLVKRVDNLRAHPRGIQIKDLQIRGW